MKFRCDHEVLLNAVNQAQGVTDTKGTNTVLRNIKFIINEASKKVEILATDGQMTFRQSISLKEVDEDFSMVLPGDKVVGIIRETSGDVNLTYRENIGLFTIGKSQFQVIADISGDYPNFPEFIEEGNWSLPGSYLKEMAVKTTFACTEDTSRYAMNGVFMKAEGKEVGRCGEHNDRE